MNKLRNEAPISNTIYTYAGMRLPIVLLIIYYWWLICTPQVRFPQLGDLYFEKLLAFAWMCSIFAQKEKAPVASPITNLLISLYFLVLILSWITPVPKSSLLSLWQTEYWKKIMFFFMGVMTIRDRKDFFHALTGIAIVMYGYQLLSWRDFLAGGSYVYQQGLKRMTGMWVVNSYGAGNYWGYLSAFCTPLALYGFLRSSQKLVKLAYLALLGILLLSILFSGSRGSLVSVGLFYIYHFRTKLINPKYIMIGVLSIMIAVPFVPPEYKKRYSMIFVKKDDVHTGTKAEQIAKDSAANRLQGLLDGWWLLFKYPQGCGPGQSALARNEINYELRESGQVLQLHNLYGQIMSETGFLGTILILILGFQTYKNLKIAKPEDDLKPEKDAIKGIALICLIYGMGAHSLYTEQWIWILMFAVATHNLSPNNPANIKKINPADQQ